MTLIVLLYILIFTAELLYVHFYLNNWQHYKKDKLDEYIEFNLKHKDELNKKLAELVNERIALLDTMEYSDWIDYNIKNEHITVFGKSYHFSVWERNKIAEYSRRDESNYTVRVSSHPEFINLSFKSVVNLVNYNFLYGVYKPSPDIANNLWELSGMYKHGTGLTNFFWLSEDGKYPVEKTVIFDKYKKLNLTRDDDYSKIGFQGVLSIGYDIRNLDLDYGKVYYDFLGWNFFIMASVTFFFLTNVLYYVSNTIDIITPILFLFLTNIYLMYFLSFQAGLTNRRTEENKLIDINSGISAISFLVAVNIFIVQTLQGAKKSNKWFLHPESTVLFCLSLILLLISSTKKTNFFNITELRVHNIIIQFFFNMSIIINLIIFINYLIYIVGISKYFKRTFK